MKVYEYIEKRKAALERFALDWINHQDEEGVDNWPEDLTDEQWFEQEAAFFEYADRT
ncbi:hypothetical protein [Pseudomonas sp. zfem003]|uniref:hypothetical protein n=1 Tax=Pseudomonas sp. zfem003 TaxID=3078198 RepID=UPI002929DDF8|nr:hypothetical protein [Pseudomonas sp. zfem003]MDU9398079.1 hypothetical protein [Pseudomonas sp. zfem003]